MTAAWRGRGRESSPAVAHLWAATALRRGEAGRRVGCGALHPPSLRGGRPPPWCLPRVVATDAVGVALVGNVGGSGGGGRRRSVPPASLPARPSVVGAGAGAGDRGDDAAVAEATVVVVVVPAAAVVGAAAVVATPPAMTGTSSRAPTTAGREDWGAASNANIDFARRGGLEAYAAVPQIHVVASRPWRRGAPAARQRAIDGLSYGPAHTSPTSALLSRRFRSRTRSTASWGSLTCRPSSPVSRRK